MCVCVLRGWVGRGGGGGDGEDVLRVHYLFKGKVFRNCMANHSAASLLPKVSL